MAAKKQEFVLTAEEKRTDIPKDANYLSLHVEVGFSTKDENGNTVDVQLPVPQCDYAVADLRGNKTWFSDFRTAQRDDQLVFMFEAFQRIPEGLPVFSRESDVFACSYVELCWYTGAAPVSKDQIPSVITKLSKGATVQDLGWILPSRFVDSIAVTLGVLNSEVLGGVLIDAILYGPFVSHKESGN